MSDNLFNRSVKLFLANDSTTRDLSDMKIRFYVNAEDNETPNTARIRVYNLAEATVMQVIKEYSTVILQAGYGENFGVIFQGTVKQYKRGKESAVDSYLDIFGGDGDTSYNFGFMNRSIVANSTPQQRLKLIADAMNLSVEATAESQFQGGILARGKVFFNLGRAYARNLAQTHGARWSIQNGVLTMIPLTGYLNGDIVELNSTTGLIGIPEATDNGVMVTCLLNPNIVVGGRVRINNRDITATTIKEQGFPGYKDLTLPAYVSDDGVYRVIVVEHEGDIRGQAWYSHLTCLSVDVSTDTVKAFG